MIVGWVGELDVTFAITVTPKGNDSDGAL